MIEAKKMKMDKKKWLYVGIGAAAIVVIVAIILLVVLLPKNDEPSNEEPENPTENLPVVYEIALEEVQNSQISVNKNEAAEGDVITVTAKPSDGYESESLYYYIGESRVTIENSTFTMPASDITVGGTFSAVGVEITAVSNNEKGVVTGAGTYQVGDAITLETDCPDWVLGLGFLGWYAGDEMVSESLSYTFTLSEDSPTSYTARYLEIADIYIV